MLKSFHLILKAFKPPNKYSFAIGLSLLSSLYVMNANTSSHCYSQSANQISVNIHKPTILIRNKQNQQQVVIYPLTAKLFAVISTGQSKIQEEDLVNNSFNVGEESVKIVKVIGKFDNFTIVQVGKQIFRNTHSTTTSEPALFDEVTVIDSSQLYPQIRKGHITGSKLFSHVIDINSCKPGSVVLFKGKTLGVISSVEKDGFSTMIPLSVLSAVSNRINSGRFNPHLGISVKNADDNTGSFVVRIATSSPFAPHVKLGDIITKINNIDVRSPENIKDLINSTEGQVPITVLRDGKEISFVINTM